MSGINKIKSSRAYRKTNYIIYKQTLLKPSDHFWTFIGAFIGIGIIGFIQSIHFSSIENIMLIGSFGASAVLIYGATNSPLAQPRNLIGGHIISAIIGVTIMKLLPNNELDWLRSSLAVSLAIVAMQITKTMHPPGGATALIATIGSTTIVDLGYWYVLSPVFTGVIILFIIAIIVNNLPKNRQYPVKPISIKKLFTKQQ